MEHDDYMRIIGEMWQLIQRQDRFIDHLTAQLRAYTIRELCQNAPESPETGSDGLSSGQADSQGG